MVVGATTSGVFLVAYVLAMEMVGPKFRFGFHISGVPGKAILFESAKKILLLQLAGLWQGPFANITTLLATC